MKKALLISLSFVLVCCLLVSGTFATELSTVIENVFKTIEQLGAAAMPTTDPSLDVTITTEKGSDSSILSPGHSASLKHTVTNTGDMDVYFRLYYAVPADDTIAVSFTVPTGYDTVSASRLVNNGKLKMWVITYAGSLAKGTSAPAVEVTVAFDKTMTDEQFSQYKDGKFLQTQVLAIETQEFDNHGDYSSYSEALDAALPLESTNPF